MSPAAPIDCRGANTAAEFDRQWRKTVAAVSGTEADVVAFMEMENDGYGPDSAVQFLVDRLNDEDGAGTWAFIDADARTGQVDALGDDAIKVGMLYKPGEVTPVGATGVLNTVAFVNGGDQDPRNRPALAQAFRDNATGGVFVGVANHLKSKGSACDEPDAGDGQANCNAVRARSAALLADWLATRPDGHRRPRRADPRRPQLLRQGGPDHDCSSRRATPTSSSASTAPRPTPTRSTASGATSTTRSAPPRSPAR